MAEETSDEEPTAGWSAPGRVSGQCDPRFAAVQEEFVANFADRGETGGGVCVVVDGTVVAELRGRASFFPDCGWSIPAHLPRPLPSRYTAMTWCCGGRPGSGLASS